MDGEDYSLDEATSGEDDALNEATSGAAAWHGTTQLRDGILRGIYQSKASALVHDTAGSAARSALAKDVGGWLSVLGKAITKAAANDPARKARAAARAAGLKPLRSSVTDEYYNAFGKRSRIGGGILVSALIAIDLYNISQSDDKMDTTLRAGGQWGGAWAGGELGASIGTFVGGPVCALFGGLIGAGIGGIVGEEGISKLSHAQATPVPQPQVFTSTIQCHTQSYISPNLFPAVDLAKEAYNWNAAMHAQRGDMMSPDDPFGWPDPSTMSTKQQIDVYLKSKSSRIQ
jgi:hypothetical protein